MHLPGNENAYNLLKLAMNEPYMAVNGVNAFVMRILNILSELSFTNNFFQDINSIYLFVGSFLSYSNLFDLYN